MFSLEWVSQITPSCAGFGPFLWTSYILQSYNESFALSLSFFNRTKVSEEKELREELTPPSTCTSLSLEPSQWFPSAQPADASKLLEYFPLRCSIYEWLHAPASPSFPSLLVHSTPCTEAGWNQAHLRGSLEYPLLPSVFCFPHLFLCLYFLYSSRLQHKSLTVW